MRAIAAIFIGLMLVAATAAQTVSGSVKRVRRGGATTGTIVLTIPQGFHVNSNRPNSRYLIPTSVALTSPGATVTLRAYPAGKNKLFAFSEEPLNVYEGRVRFDFKLSVPRNFRRKTARITVRVSFQPCTDEVCYQPQTKRLTVTARIY